MPQVTLNFPDEASIPASLKAFKKADSNDVIVWAGDNVAGETNPALELSRNTVLSEKKALQDKYDGIEATNNTLSKEIIDLRQKVALSSGEQVTADDVAILQIVKPVLGDKADDVKKKLTAATEASTRLPAIEREMLVKSVSNVLGFQETVLNNLLSQPSAKDMNLSIEDVTENGQSVKKVMATIKNAAGVTEKKDFASYVAETPGWKEFLPSLKVEQKGPAWIKQNAPAPVPQGSQGQQSTGNILQDHINKKNAQATAKPNPLRPNAAPAVVQPQTPTAI